jgi:hypothetical protein
MTPAAPGGERGDPRPLMGGGHRHPEVRGFGESGPPPAFARARWRLQTRPAGGGPGLSRAPGADRRGRRAGARAGASPRASAADGAAGCPRKSRSRAIRWPSRGRCWPRTPRRRSRGWWASGPPAGQRGRRLRSAAAVVDRATPRCARREGFSRHATVAVPAPARGRLEHLCRSLLRPPLALERLPESPHACSSRLIPGRMGPRICCWSRKGVSSSYPRHPFPPTHRLHDA